MLNMGIFCMLLAIHDLGSVYSSLPDDLAIQSLFGWMPFLFSLGGALSKRLQINDATFLCILIAYTCLTARYMVKAHTVSCSLGAIASKFLDDSY